MAPLLVSCRYDGGANDDGHGGTIFKITPGGTLTTRYSFCAALSQQGYRKDSISEQIFVISDLSRWLERSRTKVQELDGSVVDQFPAASGADKGDSAVRIRRH